MWLIDSIIRWFDPTPLHDLTALKSARTKAVNASAREMMAEMEMRWVETEMAYRRQAERQERLDRLQKKRNSMIGRLDDCRWRVSVLMASKKLPADYAMRLGAHR